MRHFCWCILLLFATKSGAQTLCQVIGAEVYAGPGLQVSINGSIALDSQAHFQNFSELHISGDLINKGQLEHSGSVFIQGNWVNDSIFQANPISLVEFNGAAQQIEGTHVCRFGQLKLSGTGDKNLLQTAEAEELDLSDRLLITDSSRIRVLSNDVQAIERTSGYVISNRFGSLERALQTGVQYLYPVGSLSNYQPVFINPAGNSTYAGVRFAAVDASTEGLPRTQVDTTICRSNASFFHLFYGDLAAGSSISMNVATSDVNSFPFLAQRNPQQTGVWTLVPSSTTLVSGGITAVNHTLSTAIDSRAFLLVRGRPSRPIISGDTAFCKKSLNRTFTITHDSTLVTNWTLASGNIVQQNDSVLIVNWGEESNGLVSAFQSDSAGCSSFPASHSVILWDNPVANFVIDAPDLPYEDVPFTLTSLSSGAVGQYWSIANLMNYSDSVIQVVFDAPGVYPVLLQVVNEFGCSDTASGIIEVIEGMVIPNTFSPNGDGINDELYLINSGVQEFNLKIFDRWGVLVFETNASKLSWDGKTSSGERVPAGTHMMVLSAKTANSTFEKRGALTIFD